LLDLPREISLSSRSRFLKDVVQMFRTVDA